MLFDFYKFADITASVFPGGPYTLDEALGVFQYYFEQYEAYTGRPHPPICASQIVRIIRGSSRPTVAAHTPTFRRRATRP